MSGHETIRVLEVEVDASLPSSVSDTKSEGKAEEAAARPAEQPEVESTQDGLTLPQNAGGVGKSWSYQIMMVHGDLTQLHCNVNNRCENHFKCQ